MLPPVMHKLFYAEDAVTAGISRMCIIILLLFLFVNSDLKR